MNGLDGVPVLSAEKRSRRKAVERLEQLEPLERLEPGRWIWGEVKWNV
jgi:hypothetical protein